MATSDVISCKSVETWNEMLQKHKDTGKPMVVNFKASYGPSVLILGTFNCCAQKYPQVIFVQVDVDELKSIADEYSVECTPKLLFFKNGEILKKITCALKDDLQKTVEKLASA